MYTNTYLQYYNKIGFISVKIKCLRINVMYCTESEYLLTICRPLATGFAHSVKQLNAKGCTRYAMEQNFIIFVLTFPLRIDVGKIIIITNERSAIKCILFALYTLLYNS